MCRRIVHAVCAKLKWTLRHGLLRKPAWIIREVRWLLIPIPFSTQQDAAATRTTTRTHRRLLLSAMADASSSSPSSSPTSSSATVRCTVADAANGRWSTHSSLSCVNSQSIHSFTPAAISTTEAWMQKWPRSYFFTTRYASDLRGGDALWTFLRFIRCVEAPDALKPTRFSRLLLFVLSVRTSCFPSFFIAFCGRSLPVPTSRTKEVVSVDCSLREERRVGLSATFTFRIREF